MLEDYYQTAKENESVFRNILRDLKSCRKERPMGTYIPEDLDTEANLEEIFKKYSEGNRYGRFTILNFLRPNRNLAVISFEDIAFLSGAGAELEYLIRQDDSIEYKRQTSVWMS